MTRALRSLALAGAVLALGLCAAGCGQKQTDLDVAAPPPSTPNAQREVSPTKRMPAAPPAVGAPGK